MKFKNDEYQLPELICRAIQATTEEYDLEEYCRENELDINTVVSTTTLVSPTQLQVLKRRHDPVVEYGDCLFMIMGSAAHSLIEKAGYSSDAVVEKRLHHEVNGFNVSGKIDAYQDGVLYDWKMTTKYSFQKGEAIKDEWAAQGNVNAWLLRRAGYTVDRIEYWGLLRDWQGRDRDNEQYPDCPFAVIECPVWDDLRVQEYIEDRITDLSSALEMVDEMLPPCTDAETWNPGTKYAVHKLKRDGTPYARADKLCNSMAEAEEHGKSVGSHHIDTRPGEPARCPKYCQVAEHCIQWQAHLKNSNPMAV